jgi:hypothetical protein
MWIGLWTAAAGIAGCQNLPQESTRAKRQTNLRSTAAILERHEAVRGEKIAEAQAIRSRRWAGDPARAQRTLIHILELD